MPRKKTSRRVLSGLGAASKKKCKRVSRKAAQGRKGRLKKGCRYLKGDGAICCPAGRKKATRKKATRKKATRKKAAKKVHAYSLKSSLPFKKGKRGKKVLKKGCSKRTSGPHKGKIVCKRKMSRKRAA